MVWRASQVTGRSERVRQFQQSEQVEVQRKVITALGHYHLPARQGLSDRCSSIEQAPPEHTRWRDLLMAPW